MLVKVINKQTDYFLYKLHEKIKINHMTCINVVKFKLPDLEMIKIDSTKKNIRSAHARTVDTRICWKERKLMYIASLRSIGPSVQMHCIRYLSGYILHK
jgi:hypothetical protein